MKTPPDTWLIDPSEDTWANGLSDVLNEDAPTLDHPLFHYTTEAGLDGILRGQALWASSIAYMDDPGEVQLSWKMIAEITSNWSGRSWEFDKIVRSIPTWFASDTRRERFVISFCSQPDYLLAWRAYAIDSTGYCLEFPPSTLKTEDGWYLAKVEYDKQEHESEIRRLLTRLETAYMSVERTVHRQHLEMRTAITTAMWLSLIAPTYKDAQYESEKEWRLIRVNFADEAEQLPLKVDSRLRGGEAIRYAARPLSQANIPNRVLCGARLSDATVDRVREFVQMRWPGCEVVKSNLEFRRPGR